MSYSNAVFYLDPISGSDSARTALTTVTASNPSGTVTSMNKTAHGLVTGAVVTASAFSAWLNADWKITVTDADNFTLDGAVWQATADASGTVTPFGGSSKTDAWKTFNSGATAARIAPGDTIRVIASTDPTSLGQTATWTKGSKTVTLTTAVNADIDTGGANWTQSANVTCTTSSTRKEGTLSSSIAIAAGFTTGLAAYKAFSATDFSGYQQVSFWLLTNAAFTSGQLQIKLCSDNAGATPVDTLDIPTIPAAAAGAWIPITIDKGSALGSSIQSVALYVATDFGAVTVQLDNVIACKASSSADALTLQSLIGKVHNLNWAAATAYSVNDIRKPTTTNRNGFRYKVTSVAGTGTSGGSEPTWPQELGATVTDNAGANQVVWTCDSLEESWHGIQSIRGTTILLDNGATASAAAGRGYHGTTETVATYKREPILLTAVSGNTAILGAMQDSGSVVGGQITFSGGWNRTDMTSQNAAGETWLSGQTNGGSIIDFNGKSFLTIANISAVNCTQLGYFSIAGSIGTRLNNCHASGTNFGIVNTTGVEAIYQLAGYVSVNAASAGLGATGTNPVVIGGRCVALHSSISNGLNTVSGTLAHWNLAYVEAKNNGASGLSDSGLGLRPKALRNLITSDNVTAGLLCGANDIVVHGAATMTDSTPVSTVTAYGDARILFTNLNAAGAKIYTDGGTIAQATDQRNTGSGYSWKFLPTSTTRCSDYPLTLPLARVYCAANVGLTFGIYVRRDNTNIKGRLMVKGGQIAGIGADAYTDCAPSTNTWAQYTLAVTPTAAGVIEVSFECYDGVGTANSLWVDDFSKT